MKTGFLLFIAASFLMAACSNKAETHISNEKKDSAAAQLFQKNRKEAINFLAVADIVDAFNDQHFIASFKDYHPDIIDYGDGSGPPIKGFDSVRNTNLPFFNSFSNFKAEDVHIAADGDIVILWAKWSATWSKDFAGQKATGKTFKVRDADVFRFDDNGKILEHHAIQPVSTILTQIGMRMYH